MGFTSILDKKPSPYKEGLRPLMFSDLNLDQIISSIQYQYADTISEYFHYLPADKECEEYRREILKDIVDLDLRKIFQDYVDEIKASNEAMHMISLVSENVQKRAWYLSEVYHYTHAVKVLYESLKEKDVKSEGINGLIEYLFNYMNRPVYKELSAASDEMYTKIHNFRLIIDFDFDTAKVKIGTANGDYENFLKTVDNNHNNDFRFPFYANPNLTELETELLLDLTETNKEFFKSLKLFKDNSKAYRDEVLTVLAGEVRFYLSFLLFKDNCARYKLAFCFPTTDEDKPMAASEMYDLSLALVNVLHSKPTVPNDMFYDKDEHFMVVTGPNQGGKTTYARSLGQLLFFEKVGLYVPAKSANVHYFNGILTHFSVEESIESGKGKLQEELTRLKPMFANEKRGGFVIINELFTTAANYDACIMGVNVIKHFISHGFHGIYVTHLRELSTACEGVVSLRATLDENNVQNFKIIRSAADDSDCASNLIAKHKVTYDELIKRFEKPKKKKRLKHVEPELTEEGGLIE